MLQPAERGPARLLELSADAIRRPMKDLAMIFRIPIRLFGSDAGSPDHSRAHLQTCYPTARFALVVSN
jgi:hypothetical protein